MNCEHRKSMKFQEHKGSLDRSMETSKIFDNSCLLLDYLQKLLYPWYVEVNSSIVHSEFYAAKEARIGWEETWIITVDNLGVVGYTDEKLVFN